MISARTSPADLVARILQPLARSLEEARQHLDLERVDEASTDGAGTAQEVAPPTAAPAAGILTPRRPPSGPLASGQPVGDAAPNALHPTSAPLAPAAVTSLPARPASASPTPPPSPAPASPTSTGFDHATARVSGPAAPGGTPAAARAADMGGATTSPTPPAAAPSPEPTALRAGPASAAVRLVHAGPPANPVLTGPARGTNTHTAPATLAPPATRAPDGSPPQTALAPPGGMHAPSAPRQWRLRPSPPTETAPPPPRPSAAAASTPPPPRNAAGAAASPIPRDPALPRVMQAMAPVFETAWRLTDAALPAERGEPPSVTPEAPRVANHFHVNVALGDAAGSVSRDRSPLEEALTALLRDAARRQGLDV